MRRVLPGRTKLDGRNLLRICNSLPLFLALKTPFWRQKEAFKGRQEVGKKVRVLAALCPGHAAKFGVPNYFQQGVAAKWKGFALDGPYQCVH